MPFVEEQKYLVGLVSLLNEFGFECLLQGLKGGAAERDMGDFRLKDMLQGKRDLPPLMDQYSKVFQHSTFNLSVITQAE